MEIGGEQFINSDSILDRIAELEEEYDGADAIEPSSELYELREVAGQACLTEGNNVVFYREDYFTEAMEEDAYDLGFIQRESPVASHVNWDEYADAVMTDYQEYKIAGYTYYARG